MTMPVDLDATLRRIERRLNHLVEVTEERGPGRVECAKCGGVRNMGEYVLRPGVNYTHCSSCSDLITMYVSTEKEDKKHLQHQVCATCDNILDDCYIPCHDKKRMKLFNRLLETEMRVEEKLLPFKWTLFKKYPPREDQMCIIWPADITAIWSNNWGCFRTIDGVNIPDNEITYWMARPKPPEEK